MDGFECIWGADQMELASPATMGGSVNRDDIFYAIT